MITRFQLLLVLTLSLLLLGGMLGMPLHTLYMSVNRPWRDNGCNLLL